MSVEFETALAELRTRDPRYSREAYVFIFEALNYTQRTLGRQHHVSGQELLEGIRALARQQFGYLAKTVFNEWGLDGTADFGRVVFNLVDANLMGKQDTDTLDDFADHYDFTDTFERGFRLEPPAEPVADPAGDGDGDGDGPDLDLDLGLDDDPADGIAGEDGASEDDGSEDDDPTGTGPIL